MSFTLAFVGGSVLSIGNSIAEEERDNSEMMAARSINLLLFSYAQDHGGKYPTGKSSTEIFQQLIDQKYTTDPAIFYFSMPGKSKPEGSKLKPENVCWDVTNSVVPDDTEMVPVVFSTGYKIDYVTDGKAYPTEGKHSGLAISYKGNFAIYLPSKASDGIIYNVLAAAFDPKGRTYQQLTPTGPLP